MTPLRTYYRGHDLTAMVDVPAGATRYFHFDHQGTTQALTDQSGAVTDRFAADAWGVQVKRTGTSINRHWYVGNWGYSRQPGAALEYVRARYLRCNHGNWLSVDPLLAARSQVRARLWHRWQRSTPGVRKSVPQYSLATVHRYLYGDGAPAGRVDPSGHACTVVPGSVIAWLHTPPTCEVKENWLLGCLCRCHAKMEVEWTMSWIIDTSRGGSDLDCFVAQHYTGVLAGPLGGSDRQFDPDPPYGPYRKDCEPYPSQQVYCQQYDKPGVHYDGPCIGASGKKRGTFTTCLCEVAGQPIACFEWRVHFEFQRNCRQIACLAQYLGRVVPPARACELGVPDPIT